MANLSEMVIGHRVFLVFCGFQQEECPSPPGKPFLDTEAIEKDSDVIAIRWVPPVSNGGVPIRGYLVEHKRTGSPHWLRATPYLVLDTKLPLTGLEPGWKYQFRVSAGNEVGFSNPSELSEPLIVTSRTTVVTPPFFNVELQNKCGLENEKVEFRVQFIGVPPPKISWYKDGFEVFSSRKTKIVTEDDFSVFIIHQAALEDEGEIKCTATNRAGHAVTKAYLKLEAPPRIRLPRQYKDGLLFEKGESIRLKATVAGRPKPQVTWYHNGEVLQNSDRFEIIDSKISSTLKIMDASRNDRGEYQVTGINKIGEDTASFLVTVTDRPSAPGKVQVEALGRKVNLTWLAPEDDGGCKIGTYVVEYFRVGWDIWLKARNSRQLTTSIENLIEGSQYKFRVRAENPYGLSLPSEESDTIFIPDLKRGILEPSQVSKRPSVLEEVEKSLKALDERKIETEDIKKRWILEEKAQRLLDTRKSDLLPHESVKLDQKITISTPDTIIFGFGDTPPLVPRRKNKGRNRLKIDTDMNMKPTSVSLSSIQSPTKPNIMKESILSNSSETDKNFFDFLISKKTLLEMGKCYETTQICDKKSFSIESPLFPREIDDNEIHGSSELMLVVYSRDRSKSTELSAQYRSEIEIDLKKEGVAPPMSLSSPELGCAESFALPSLRNAVSSTELLAEKTATRLYEDSIKEDIQNVSKLNFSLNRHGSGKKSDLAEGLPDKKYSFRKQIETQGTRESMPIVKVDEPESKNELLIEGLGLSEASPSACDLTLRSIEKERLELARIRRELQQKELLTNGLYSSNDASNASTTTTASNNSTIDDADSFDENYPKDGYIKVKLPKDTKSLQLSKKRDFEDEKKVQVQNNIRLLRSNEELNRKLPVAVSLEGHLIYDAENNAANQKLTNAESKKYSSLSALQSPKENSKEKIKKTTKILKKFGLKRDKKVLEITTVDPVFQPALKPILKNKIPPAKSKISPMKLLIPAKSSDKFPSEEESETETTNKKKKVRITEPETKEEPEKATDSSIDQNAVENQVFINHYSDIVREFGGSKRPKLTLQLSFEKRTENAEKESKGAKNGDKTGAKKSKEKFQNGATEESLNDSNRNAEVSTGKNTAFSFPKFRESLEYAADVAMFIFACWLYLFKNELYAIPVLFLMAYKQLKDITLKNYKKLKNKFTSKTN